MKAITTPKAWLAAMLLVLCASAFTACSNDDNHTSADATQLMGLYDVTITPSIGQQKMAQGSHTLYAELTVACGYTGKSSMRRCLERTAN